MNIDLNKAIEVLQACGYECEEIESLRQQLAAAQEEVTLDEQRVADLMGQVGELSNQLSSRDAEIDDLGDDLAQVKLKNELLIAERDALRKQLSAKDEVINTAKIALTIACRYANDYDHVPFLAGEQALAITEPKP